MLDYTRIVSSLLFPLHERVKGHDTCTILRSLESSQWLAPDALRAHQARMLANFIALVALSVPYYRTLFAREGIDPAAFAAHDARDAMTLLATLPLIDKSVIRANSTAFRAEGASDLIPQRTSGSSGEPLHFLLSRFRMSFDIAAKWRATRWWNVGIGDRELVLWGSAIETGAQDRVRRLRDTLFRSRLVPTHDLTPTRLAEILAEMRDWHPRMLFGYPSALSRLAFHALEHGPRMDDLGIAVAFCTSEVLRPEWREAIGHGLGCGVANEYGARDAGFIARECPAGGLHITAEEVIVEIVDADGRRLPDGEEGEIVVTNLAGPGFPFLRYRTGDRGVLSTATCACGRGLPLLERLSGRANDGLRRLDGGWVHGSAVNHMMRDLAGLRAYQIVQARPDSVSLRLELDGALPAAARDGMIAHLHHLLGEAVEVQVEQVVSIPPQPNGKFRHIICLVDEHAASNEECATPPMPTNAEHTEHHAA